ncbi:glycosyl hydrolase 2 galactose-binding domain-containing protein [Gordonia sp. NPDC003376]
MNGSTDVICHKPGRTELVHNWTLTSVDAGDDSHRPPESGIAIPAMPATILKAHVDAGVYDKDLYVGDNLTTIDQDLWTKDWWYSTTFTAPAGHERYTLAFDGISYRAEIWLNGTLLAGPTEVVGSYRRFEFDVTDMITAGGDNRLAVRITPERNTPSMVITDIVTDGEPTGVDLTDTWADWLCFAHHGDAENKQTFLPDKNSGIFRRVWLTFGGPVSIRHPYVQTELPLPATDSAELTVHADIRNHTSDAVSGIVRGHITRADDAAADTGVDIRFAVPMTLEPGEERGLTLDSGDCAALHVPDPELWWPYTWGDPTLHTLDLEFEVSGSDSEPSDRATVDFGIRHITAHRDDTIAQPQFDDPSSFYIAINGRDYLVRGGAYSPDLFFESNDPDRVRTILDHAIDLGVNLLRWEGHIIDDGLLELADRMGMPAMLGTMCCGAWERWSHWNAEDYEIAQLSVADTVKALRAHPAIVIWSNGSDGMPPDGVLEGYHRSLDDAQWQNAVLDTVSTRNRDWSGVHMNGPYTWRAPVFWYLPDNDRAIGSCAEEGNNEVIPVLSSLEKMLPGDALWPYNKVWSMHTGATNLQMAGTRRVIDRRMGGAQTVEEFVDKAQIIQYEAARGMLEGYTARGWETNKFIVYWMLNSPWPSFFGQVFDWWYGKGGTYFGAKKALRPLTVAFDHYATGDKSTGRVHLINQTLDDVKDLTLLTRIYRSDGTLVESHEQPGLSAPATSTGEAFDFARPTDIGAVYFVRLTLSTADAETVVDNTYWLAVDDDVPDLRVIDGIFDAMKVRQTVWPDFRPLFSLPEAQVDVTAREITADDETSRRSFEIRLHNPGPHLAYFVRVELRDPATGEEVTPTYYDDNYVTVYPEEQVVLVAELPADRLAGTPILHVEGINLI